MACNRYFELLSARLDRELTKEEAEEIELHRAGCSACRIVGAQLDELREAFADLEDIPAPEGFAQGVMDRIRAESPEKPVISLFKRPQFRALAGLAACAALVIGLASRPQPQNADETTVLARDLQRDAFVQELDETALTAPYPDTDSPDLTDVEPTSLEPTERWSNHALLILDHMPEGAEGLIPSEVAVSYNMDTDEEGYNWLTEDEPEALARIERLAQEQGITAERSSAPVEDAWYHLFILSPTD